MIEVGNFQNQRNNTNTCTWIFKVKNTTQAFPSYPSSPNVQVRKKESKIRFFFFLIGHILGYEYKEMKLEFNRMQVSSVYPFIPKLVIFLQNKYPEASCNSYICWYSFCK